MQTIDHHELHAQLRHGAEFQLLRVCGIDDSGSIPGSLILPADLDPALVLDADRPTVVYGCGPACEAATRTVVHLASQRFCDVRLYPAGIGGWQHAARSIQH